MREVTDLASSLVHVGDGVFPEVLLVGHLGLTLHRLAVVVLVNTCLKHHTQSLLHTQPSLKYIRLYHAKHSDSQTKLVFTTQHNAVLPVELL